MPWSSLLMASPRLQTATRPLDAEKCIADIGEAVLDGDTVDARQRCTLEQAVRDFAFDSDAITPLSQTTN